ncbi:putative transcription factor WRKY family [Helianthus annuus]|nr:putative transcription factor WRKY family [Helianthus annuus]KAJ0699533.1 putative transcription factor WRKY family [Helianthus annuus]KAJ0882840.1 putative transcription factor WRKY family [Helianthus annuus]
MDSSGRRLSTSASISRHQIFSYYNSFSNLVSNDTMNEELNSSLFNFDNEIDSSNQFLTPFSPSSFIPTYPNQFFDSPSFLFNSNIISTPASGNYFGYDFEKGKTNVSDLVSRSQTSPTTISRNKMEDSLKSQVQDWNGKSEPKQIGFSMEISKIKPEPESLHSSHRDCKLYPIQASKTQSKFEDGYNWRKYGQKQVKGSKKPRSYYKCSYPECPSKKKVEKDLNGYIAQVIYKGKHNHPMPHNMKALLLNSTENTIFDYSIDKNRFESSSQNSFASFGEDEYDQDSSLSKSGNDYENETDLPNAKRWKIDEAESEEIAYVGSKAVQEPKVVIQMKSEIDILDDGYKWRKYGQKVVKGNPNPRSYYKCTNIGCPVRKLVERASHDLQSVIITYEAKHNHGVPSRGVGSYATTQPPKSNTTKASNNCKTETSMYLPDYSYNVQSNDFGFMETSYPNQDWIREKFKEEPENDFIYNSF